MDETIGPEYVHHDPSNPADLRSMAEDKHRLAEVMAAFPDIHYTIEDMIAEDDKFAVCWTVSGTHMGVFNGIPPTGKRVAIQGILIHRLSIGRIVEEWVVRDTLGLLHHLGVIPGPERAARSA